MVGVLVAALCLSGLSVPVPAGREATLVADAAEGVLQQMDLLEAALVASGVPDAELSAMRERLRRAVAPAIARARKKSTPAERGRVLLASLHEGVFGHYRASASTLLDVLNQGEFNCLSSALVFIIAAQDLLETPKGMLTRRHAFARVHIGGRAVDVETTVAGGFDVDRAKALAAEVIDKIARPGEDRATVVADLKNPDELPALTLVAALYANRSVPLAEAGDLQGAAVALDRATRLATGAAKTRFATWRATIINNSVGELLEDGRLDDARTLLELALQGAGDEIKRTLSLNLGRVHLRKGDVLAQQQDWGGVLEEVTLAEQLGVGAEAGNLRAVATGKLAAASLNSARCVGTADERVTCLRELTFALLDQHDDRRALQIARQAMALAASASAQEVAHDAMFFALQGRAASQSKAKKCEDVELTVSQMARHVAALKGKPFKARTLSASCWVLVGNAHYDARRWDDAAHAYRRALVQTPTEPAIQQNLARVDMNRGSDLAKQGRCDEMRPVVRRAVAAEAALGPDAQRVLEACANGRAVAAAGRSEWMEAVSELRRGLLDVPGSAVLQRNLRSMLTNQARVWMADKRCDDARDLEDELSAAGAQDVVAEVQRFCP